MGFAHIEKCGLGLYSAKSSPLSVKPLSEELLLCKLGLSAHHLFSCLRQLTVFPSPHSQAAWFSQVTWAGFCYQRNTPEDERVSPLSLSQSQSVKISIHLQCYSYIWWYLLLVISRCISLPLGQHDKGLCFSPSGSKINYLIIITLIMGHVPLLYKNSDYILL